MLDECLSDKDPIIELQVLKTKKLTGYYFGQMIYNGSQNFASLKQQNDDEEESIFSKLFGGGKKKETTAFTEHNYMIQNGFYSMHGRGMYLDTNTGELFEGWFANNSLIDGRCILDDTFYIG